MFGEKRRGKQWGKAGGRRENSPDGGTGLLIVAFIQRTRTSNEVSTTFLWSKGGMQQKRSEEKRSGVRKSVRLFSEVSDQNRWRKE